MAGDFQKDFTVRLVNHPESISRILSLGALCLLALALITGGGSMDRDWGDAATQLLAVLVLLLAIAVPAHAQGRLRRALLLLFALAAPATVAAQIILETTATPWATERAIYAWLPPAAAFFSCAVLPKSAQRRGVALLVILIGASLILAVLQLAAPQDSFLNPFPQWKPAFGGLFANQNHQGIALVMASALLLSWSPHPSEGTRALQLAQDAARYGLAALFLVAAVFTNSRAVVLICAGMLLVLPWANGWMLRLLRKRGGVLRVLGATLIQAVGVVLLIASISAWMRVDQLQEYRTLLRTSTASLAADAMPSGVGAGSFVPWFEAHMPEELIDVHYYNHAHNEYVQWWLEGGVMGLAWVLVLIVGFFWTRPHCSRRASRVDGLWVGSWLAIGCVLVHSYVDYPLRTPALATATAWLAAVVATRTLASRRVSGQGQSGRGNP